MERSLGLKAQMRDELSARQMKSHMSNAAGLVEDGHGARGIDERQISSIQFKELVTVFYGRLARELKDQAVILNAVTASAPWGAIDPLNIATRIDGLHAVDLKQA